MNSRSRPLPRFVTAEVARLLGTFPVVVVVGARQTGKSTLARTLLPPPARDYRTLDDFDVLERAQREPDALLSSKAPLTLDEVQRSPSLLLAVKRAVDRDRRQGRFLLTGSANLSLMGSVSETLAGRAVYLTLDPFTLSERNGFGGVGRWDEIVASPESLEGLYDAVRNLHEQVLASGYPAATLASTRADQERWLEGYVRTYIERDLQALSRIENLVDFRRLMRMAALRSGALLNQSELARDAGISQPTAHRYLNLLETSCLARRLHPYSVNRTKRLIKAPKLFFNDPGLAAHLAGVASEKDLERSNLAGALLETLVLNDILVWREAASPRPEVLYWRTAAGAEVDFVIESGGRVVPIEVKSSARPRLNHARSLRIFLDDYGRAAPHGIILHTGTRAERLADRIWAIPLSAALGLPSPAGAKRSVSARGPRKSATISL